MKRFMSQRIWFYAGISIFILVLLFVGLTQRYDNTRAVASDNVYGWAWSSNFGWISLNCYNYYNQILEDNCSVSDYGVNVDNETGNLEKYAWSSNFGWLAFDKAGPYPSAPNYSARAGEDGLLRGWAHAANLGSQGWIRFQGESCATSQNCSVSGTAPNYGLDNDATDGQSSICYNCNRYKKSCVSGTNPGKSCDSDSQCGEGGECRGKFVIDDDGDLMCALCFSQHLPDPCLESDSPTCSNGDKFPTGTICAHNPGIGNSNPQAFCRDCREYTSSPPNEDEKIVSCGACSQCYDYGVGINHETNRLAGWAWHQGATGNGIGWVQFNPDYTVIHGPWLETRLGGIYSQGNIGSQQTYAPPGEVFSATYEILAGGSITHFSTKAGEDFAEEEFENLTFPTQDNVYSNALGRIDFAGLYAGQYGKVQPITFSTDINTQLGGNVYHSLGDLDILSAIEFKPGDLSQPNGAGLIIVEGDLRISHNITYSDLAINRMRNLPSVAWVVKGDVIIDPNVTEISGAFIILGNGENESCPSLLSPSSGCGRLSTGQSGNKLDINGLVMARQFHFQRSFFAADRGAEQIVYDGRALANTPPGLGDMSQVLPVWQEVTPQ